MANGIAPEIQKVIEHKSDPAERVTKALAIGKVVHQGDVYLHRVAANHPRGEERGSRQVAVGTTVGSRHIAEGNLKVFQGQVLPPGVKAPEWCADGDLLGPVVVAEEPWLLTHPEHAAHRVPAGTFQVTYQADFATQRRVED
jgi:hypothetical protein